MNNIIIEAVKAAIEAYEDNELAYYALTSKVEHQIRDKIAWKTQEMLRDEIIVSREYKRIDLAVFRDKELINVFEFKSMYTFDLICDKRLPKYIKLVSVDFRKRARLMSKHSKYCAISIAVHPKRLIPAELRSIIKYDSGINRALKNYNECNIINRAQSRWDQELQRIGFTNKFHRVSVGAYRDIPVDLMVCVSEIHSAQQDDVRDAASRHP